jgi:succinyl-CoA synthetase beta subunit
MSSEAAFSLFAEFGIPVVPTVLTRNAGEAVIAAERLGFPVVLKIESADITHKSDVGGVALKLSDGEQVRDAYNRILTETSRRAPNSKIEGMVVQPMAGKGVEMSLGVKRDPLFGPVVLCGFGGLLVEVLEDVAVGIPPLSRDQAHDMLKRLRGYAILGGVRGQAAADVEALCSTVVGLSRLASSLGDQLTGLDINPLIVLAKGDGVVAVDALVQIV